MQPELDELLSGLRYLRRKAAKGDLAWLDQRYEDGRLVWLQQLFPAGGYERFGRDLVKGNVEAVRKALDGIDDATVGDKLGYRYTTRVVSGGRQHDPAMLVSIEPELPAASNSTSVFAPIDHTARVDLSNDAVQRPGANRFDEYFADDPDDLRFIDEDGNDVFAEPDLPRTKPLGSLPGLDRLDRRRPASPLRWLLVAAAVVIVFALILSRCGGGGNGSKLNTSTGTTTTTVAPTGTVAANVAPAVTTAPAATAPVGSTAVTARTPQTWVIYFALNSTLIDTDGQKVVKDVAEKLRGSAPGTPVLISGYTDSSGSPSANQQLALQRATVVRDAIAATAPQGIPKFSVDSRADTQAETDPAKSRRVTITLS